MPSEKPPVAQVRELDPCNAVLRPDSGFPGDFNRQTRFAAAAGTGQRHEPCGLQECEEIGNRTCPADERHERRGHARRRPTTRPSFLTSSHSPDSGSSRTGRRSVNLRARARAADDAPEMSNPEPGRAQSRKVAICVARVQIESSDKTPLEVVCAE